MGKVSSMITCIKWVALLRWLKENNCFCIFLGRSLFLLLLPLGHFIVVIIHEALQHFSPYEALYPCPTNSNPPQSRSFFKVLAINYHGECSCWRNKTQSTFIVQVAKSECFLSRGVSHQHNSSSTFSSITATATAAAAADDGLCLLYYPGCCCRQLYFYSLIRDSLWAQVVRANGVVVGGRTELFTR